MTDETLIASHIVGGRAGHGGFSYPVIFEPDQIRVFYEADAEAIEQIAEMHKNDNVIVLPYCLSDRDADANLNIFYDPYASSLLPAKRGNDEMFQPCPGFDCYMPEALELAETVPVKLRKLDTVLRDDPTIPQPDFIGIDVQGCSWEVIAGGAERTSRSTCCVQAEVEFTELYESEKLFGEITSLLARLGLHFARFTQDASRYYSGRVGIGLRGRCFEVSGDAIYMRRPRDLDSPKALAKLAFIACIYEHLDVAFEALHLLEERDSAFFQAGK